jgi:four helix bundle protein
MRSDISVGALRRGQGAESRADFVHKLQMALKELREVCPTHTTDEPQN